MGVRLDRRSCVLPISPPCPARRRAEKRPRSRGVKQWVKWLIHLTLLPISVGDVPAPGGAGCGYFLADFFALRGFLPPFAFDATAPAIRKSSAFLPDLIAAASQRGFNPRPAQVSGTEDDLVAAGCQAEP